MRRIAQLIVLIAVVIGMLAGPASARSFRVRTDPNDTSERADIQKVLTDRTRGRAFFRIETSDRLRNRYSYFDILLDTHGSFSFDRVIEVFPGGIAVEEWDDGLGNFLGGRRTRRPDRRSIAFHAPAGWLDIRKGVRFFVISGPLGAAHPDRAPDDGRYVRL